MVESSLCKGRIIKGIGGFYYVIDDNGNIHECRARGRFRKDEIVPLTGDIVSFETGGYIVSIQQRKNELVRPKVVNIDIVAIVVSSEKPEIDWLLADKLIVYAKKADISPLLIINKCDIAEDDKILNIVREYEKACDTICVSAKNLKGIHELANAIRGKCTCFAGQSAAGKSSILNALLPDLGLKTGELSRKTDRGTHTTRQAELIVKGDILVIDTPGFSSLDSADIMPEELSGYYDDLTPFASCRFSSCLHAGEPECGVKKAVAEGLITEGRYSRYLKILREIQIRGEEKYD